MNVVTPAASFDAPTENTTGRRGERRSAQAADGESRRSASSLQLATAAIAGAVAAAIMSVALFVVLPPRRVEDPRAAAMSRDVEDLKLQLQTMMNRVQSLDAGAVSAADTAETVSKTLKAQGAALEALRGDINNLVAASQRTGEEQAGIATPALLGIAVVQLRAAMDRGLPFDWELVNLWGIAGRQHEAALQLSRLAPLANGVPTRRQIAGELQDLVARADAGVSIASRAVQTVRWVFGTTPATDGVTETELLHRVAALAEKGDYAAAAKELRSAGPALDNVADDVAGDMEVRAVAQAATANLMAMAKHGLAGELRAATAQH